MGGELREEVVARNTSTLTWSEKIRKTMHDIFQFGLCYGPFLSHFVDKNCVRVKLGLNIRVKLGLN